MVERLIYLAERAALDTYFSQEPPGRSGIPSQLVQQNPNLGFPFTKIRVAVSTKL